MSRVLSSAYGRFEPIGSPATTFTLRALFAVAYLSFILSTVLAVRLSESVTSLVFFSRSAALIGIIAVWFFISAYRGQVNRIVAIFSLIWLPYIFTSAYLNYLDVLVVLILATSFQRSGGIEKYFVRLAYTSLALTVMIGLLACLSIIPTTEFAWRGVVKHSFGFANPNTFYFFIFSSAMVFFVFKRHVAFFLSGVAILGLFPMVGSRTFLIGYILLVGILVWPSLIHNRKGRLLLWLWLASVTALGLVTVSIPAKVTILLNAVLGLDVNELFSNRLALAEQAMAIGSVQTFLGGMANATDSLYAYFARGFGFLGLLLFLLWGYGSVVRQVQYGRPIALVIAAVYLTVGLVEVPFDGSALIAIVFASETFFSRNRQPI